MSSREISGLMGKEHRHVRRDIKNMLANLELDEKGYAQTWTDPQNGQEYEEYALPKNLTLNLIAGYRDDMRLKIIDRWMELEVKALTKISPKTPYPVFQSDVLERLKAREHATPLKPGIYGGVISFAELDTLDGNPVISVAIDLIAGRQIYDNIFVTTRGGHAALKTIGAPNGKVIGDTSDMVGCVVAVRIGVHTDRDRFNFVRNYEDPNFVLDNESNSSSKKRPVAPPSMRKGATIIPIKTMK
ncbi:Rha family transcriptional regulator [Novacetimonas pomaceti]|uniref:Rha family transcriptional regulator n=1 Tax=Novacetimonas pomaceti TaxID=2021998 RepID=UPI001EF1029F|nr:Rha family transcriptional regulator [Novacetimonas pomaceti]